LITREIFAVETNTTQVRADLLCRNDGQYPECGRTFELRRVAFPTNELRFTGGKFSQVMVNHHAGIKERFLRGCLHLHAQRVAVGVKENLGSFVIERPAMLSLNGNEVMFDQVLE